MNNLELANSVLKDVQNQRNKSAANKIQLLLKNDADLKENWGAITRLAVTIGEFRSAIRCSQKYLSISPKETKRIIQCAAILAECREIEAAIALVTPILKIKTTPDVLHFLGTTHSQIGNVEIAKEYLVKLIEIAPKYAISWLTLAAIHKFANSDSIHVAITSIQKHFDSDNSTQNAPYWFALGKASMDLKDEKQAFSYFSRGCELMKNEKAYNVNQHRKFINEIITAQDAAYLNALPSITETSIKPPIFIVGLPRSGTTLLQQMLSSHSAIGQGGELKYLNSTTAQVGQENINKLAAREIEVKAAVLKKIQADYQHLLSQQFDVEKPVVDKTLNLNHHLGLISKAFPTSTIIRIIRNPADNAWSCYRNFFNQGVSWSYSLTNIAEFFHQEERIADHWKSLLGDRVLEITYEDLVNKPEETLELCVKHIGFTFENELLSFYKQNLLVQTASVGQVRKPINQESINSNVHVIEYLSPFINRRNKLKEQ